MRSSCCLRQYIKNNTKTYTQFNSNFRKICLLTKCIALLNLERASNYQNVLNLNLERETALLLMKMSLSQINLYNKNEFRRIKEMTKCCQKFSGNFEI